MVNPNYYCNDIGISVCKLSVKKVFCYNVGYFYVHWQANSDDDTAKDLAVVMYETATLRSGYSVPDSAGFAERIEKMLRHALDIDLNEKVGNNLL